MRPVILISVSPVTVSDEHSEQSWPDVVGVLMTHLLTFGLSFTQA